MKLIRLTVSGLAVACALALSACAKPADDGIATAGNGDKSDGAPISTDPEERARQFAQCMRDQGIEMPDPEFSEEGGFSVRIGPGPGAGAEQGPPSAEEMAKTREAMKACQQYMPDGGRMGEPDPEMEEKMREFAKCMRENGVENFPDPQEGGGIIIGGPGEEGELMLDPRDPVFQAAQKKCEEFMPRLAGPAT